jgi:hypothetical protein
MKAIKLIDGNYSNEEAADILLSIIGDKIRFHQRKKLSQKERHGIDALESIQRLKELEADRAKILDLIKSSEGQNVEFSISASIDIKVNEFA